MSSTSIGTGTAGDANENLPHPADPWPSRTLGADSPAGDARRAAPAQPGQKPDPEKAGQAFPEGPHVAPSPWEQEAARGRS